MKNIEILYNTRNKNIILFDDFFTIVPESKYKTFRGNGIEVWTSRETLQKIANSTCTSKSRQYIWKFTKQN